MDSLSTANVEFCLDVFKELNYNHAGDNVFFSLLSLLYALSMILLGARGTSAEPMEKVLGTAGVPSGLGSSSEWLTLYTQKTLPSCERTTRGQSTFLMTNSLDNAIHYNANNTMHAMLNLFLAISAFTHKWLKFTFIVYLYSGLNMPENTYMVWFLPSTVSIYNKMSLYQKLT